MPASHSPSRVQRCSHSFVKRPCTVACTTLLFVFICGGVVFGLNMVAITNTNSFFLRDDIRTKQLQAVEVADDFLQEQAASHRVVPPNSDPFPGFDLFLLFRATGDSMTTPDLLRAAGDLTADFVALNTYEQVCLKDETLTACVPPTSVTAVDSPKLVAASFPQLPADGIASDANITRVLTQYATEPELDEERRYMLDSSFEAPALTSKYLRSYFPMGAPLAGYRSKADDALDQQRDFQDYIKPFHERINVDGADPPGAQVVLFGQAVWNVVFDKQIAADTVWAAGAAVFVAIWLCWHTQSLFVGTVGILQIILAFIPALFLYFAVFQIKLFESLHVLAVFVALGVGADDVIVFTDAWNQFGGDPTNLERRMEVTFKRASKAMFVTSFTTIAAFLATAVSEIAPIATFGIWAATLIFVNFVMVLTFLPAMLVLWERHIRPRERCCCRRSKLATSDGNIVDVESGGAGAADSDSGSGTPPTQPHTAVSAKALVDGAATPPAHTGNRLVERFFRNKYTPFLIRHRVAVLIAFGCVMAASVGMVTQLEPLSEEEKFLPPDHYLEVASKWMDEFSATSADNKARTSVVWGLLGIDRSGTDRFDPDDLGSPVWDRSFQLHDPAAQAHVLAACDTLENADFVLELTDCWPRDFAAWLQSDRGEAFPFVASGSPPTGFTADQHQAFEFGVRVANWTSATTAGKQALSSSELGLIDVTEVVDGRDVVFTQAWLSQVQAVLTIDITLSRDDTLPTYHALQGLVADMNTDGPASANNAFQVSEKWLWMETEAALIRNAAQGMGIAISVALAVLVLATMNYIVAVLAIVCIASIVAMVMALVWLYGWQVGVSESVTSVIVVGFSVDYVVHLATAYVESKAATRLERLTEALNHMGISIVAGACTTGGSALFLLGGVILFFVKMGILLLSVVVCSLLWSLGGFCALLAVVGPQHGAGQLARLGTCAAKSQAKTSGGGEGGSGQAGVELTAPTPAGASSPPAVC